MRARALPTDDSRTEPTTAIAVREARTDAVSVRIHQVGLSIAEVAEVVRKEANVFSDGRLDTPSSLPAKWRDRELPDGGNHAYEAKLTEHGFDVYVGDKAAGSTLPVELSRPYLKVAMRRLSATCTELSVTEALGPAPSNSRARAVGTIATATIACVVLLVVVFFTGGADVALHAAICAPLLLSSVVLLVRGRGRRKAQRVLIEQFLDRTLLPYKEGGEPYR
ncbi:MAG: hypothetical protein JKY37_12445 [Nannocystaceae bacterium]|nr:hypothetical protein [Nannocystaceae bacterium]